MGYNQWGGPPNTLLAPISGGGLGAFLGGPWGLGIGLGGSLLSALWGQQSPEQQLRRRMEYYLNPTQIGNMTNSLYGQYLGSPAFNASRQSLMGASNAIQQAYRRGAGGLGLGTGVGLNAQSLAAGSYGTGLSGLQSQAYTQAQQQAMQLSQMLAQGMAGAPYSPYMTPGQRLGGVFGPWNQFLLQYLLQGRQP